MPKSKYFTNLNNVGQVDEILNSSDEITREKEFNEQYRKNLNVIKEGLLNKGQLRQFMNKPDQLN